MAETATVYVTRYALSGGIQKATGEIEGGVFRPAGSGWSSYSGEGRDWHRTAEGAIARAEQMREEKLVSLLKQTVKLNKLDFGKHVAKAEAAHAATRQEP